MCRGGRILEKCVREDLWILRSDVPSLNSASYVCSSCSNSIVYIHV